MRKDGTEADSDELGRLVFKLPLPPSTFSTLYKADEQYLTTYYTRFPVSAWTRIYRHFY